MKAIRHGGELSKVQKRHPEAPLPWLDLSTGVNPNPYPWQDKVSPEVLLAATARLPDRHMLTACRDAWTHYLGATNPDEWTLSAGSQAVINLLPQIFPDHGISLPEPTYGEHVRVWRNANRRVSRFQSNELHGLTFPPRQVVILTNPNNPDGYVHRPNELLRLAGRLNEQSSFLIVDEAFCDVVPDVSLADNDLPSNVILMRSFGKFFGLAGLRIGCFIASHALREHLQTLLGPWSVNGTALLIAAQALNDQTWISETKGRLRRDGNKLRQTLKDAGLDIIGATDLFCLIRSADAAELAHRLARSGIYVRSFVENAETLRLGLPADDQGFARLKAALQT
ncbi:MAG: threonine-phosphate decarboxylase [Rhodospirillales bacterium]|nr:threonine-phosphate decarboxylase [Rhodospirillales bacterium]